MTRNQIEFLKYQETKRSNQATEIELARSNRERERQGQLSLDETSRHNLATEKQAADQLLEQSRHNLETEAEANRHNLASELELSTHNRATEAEAQRHNMADEANRIAQLNETIRANRATESLRDRELSERERANRASEALTRSRDTEVARANRARESLQQSQFQHQQLIDTRRLDIEQSKVDETHRHNVAGEIVATAQQVTNAGTLAERVRSDLAREAEDARHHLAMELKNYQPIVTLNNSSQSTGSTASVTQGKGSGNTGLPGGNPTQPRLPSGGGGGASTPRLISSEVLNGPYRGIAGEVKDAIMGGDVRYIREKYSDGSSKYYEEVIRNGKIEQKRQISETEYRKSTAR